MASGFYIPSQVLGVLALPALQMAGSYGLVGVGHILGKQFGDELPHVRHLRVGGHHVHHGHHGHHVSLPQNHIKIFRFPEMPKILEDLGIPDPSTINYFNIPHLIG